MAAINIVVATRTYDSEKGGWVEKGSFDITPSPIVAQSQGIEVASITGANVGDLIFVNAEALAAQAMLQGAKVTAAGTVNLYFSNAYTSTTLTLGKTHVDYILVHLS
jgi:hypothetical protein